MSIGRSRRDLGSVLNSGRRRRKLILTAVGNWYQENSWEADSKLAYASRAVFKIHSGRIAEPTSSFKLSFHFLEIGRNIRSANQHHPSVKDKKSSGSLLYRTPRPLLDTSVPGSNLNCSKTGRPGSRIVGFRFIGNRLIMRVYLLTSESSGSRSHQAHTRTGSQQPL